MARFDPRLLRDFMLFTNVLDVSRAQRFADVNGELVELIEQAWFTWTDETVHARRKHPLERHSTSVIG